MLRVPQPTTDHGILAKQRLTWEHVAYAFALTGPYRQRPMGHSPRLADRTILTVLRSLLTSGANFSNNSGAVRKSSAVFMCAQSLHKALEHDPSAHPVSFDEDKSLRVSPDERSEQYAAIKNQLFFGIGDTLGFLLASATANAFSPSLDAEEFATLAYAASFDMLAGHPTRESFSKWLEQVTDHARSIRRTENKLSFHILEFFGRSDSWSFWREWYQGFLDGKPLDWELQHRVALIPDEDWEKGPEHIAEKIEKIRAAYNSEQAASEPRAPEHEPDNVTELFKHPRSISASLSLSAQTIAQGFESFRAESGLNETPEFLAPLEAIPAYLNRITTILETQPQSATAEQALREEIGRLSAKVALLEFEISKLKTDLETRDKPWFGKVATLSAGVVTLVSGLWVVSGDELGPKRRAENLVQYWEHLFPLEETEQERPTLPNFTDT